MGEDFYYFSMLIIPRVSPLPRKEMFLPKVVRDGRTRRNSPLALYPFFISNPCNLQVPLKQLIILEKAILSLSKLHIGVK